MRDNSCAKTDTPGTQKKCHRRAAVVWVLDETGYHAIPADEYEARKKAGNVSSDTSSEAVIKTPKKETPKKTALPTKPSNYNSGISSQKPVGAKDTLPETYTVEDIMTILRVGRSGAYNLVHSKAFPVIKVGNLLRIPKSSFHEWLSNSPTIFP